MKVQMIISGVGGQGVLLITRIFAYFALEEGYPIIGSEDHGMSQRGGSVMTHLKIGDFQSPLVKKGDADLLLSLEKNEAYRTLPYLRPSTNGKKGGLCFINSSDPNFMNHQVKSFLEERGIEIHIFSAESLAKEMGLPQSINIALIGFATAHPRFPFPYEKLKKAIERVTHPQFRGLNLIIFERAALEGKKSMDKKD
ncbi:MAG: indolepyruvate oxidoreductase subunit beta [Thermodesulfobacteriota bacterium]